MDVYLKSRGEGFGSEPKRRILIGTYALSSGYYDAYYKKAQEVKELIRQDFAKASSHSAAALLMFLSAVAGTGIVAAKPSC